MPLAYYDKLTKADVSSILHRGPLPNEAEIPCTKVASKVPPETLQHVSFGQQVKQFQMISKGKLRSKIKDEKPDLPSNMDDFSKPWAIHSLDHPSILSKQSIRNRAHWRPTLQCYILLKTNTRRYKDWSIHANSLSCIYDIT